MLSLAARASPLGTAAGAIVVVCVLAVEGEESYSR